MFDKLLGGMMDKEQITKDTLSLSLIAIAKEFNLDHKSLAFMIRPTDDEFNFKVYAIRLENSQPKEVMREVTVKEIVEPTE